MRRPGRPLAAALTTGLVAVLLGCSDYAPRRAVDEFEAEVKILKDAESARSKQGERLAGYLAEYQEDFQARRIFLSMEILKYVKGERLAMKGLIGQDTVRVSYGDPPVLEVPIVYVVKAGPPGIKPEVEKLVPPRDKKR